MSGFTRFPGISTVIMGLALLCVPLSLQAQTAEERAREQELRQRIEERLQAVQEERLIRIEEAMARAKAQMEEAAESHREFDETRLQYFEQMLVQAQTQAEHAQINQEEAFARQLTAQAENLARAEEARHRYQEAAAGYREQAEEARIRALEQVREAQQQVMVRVRSRVRLGVSLDGTQGDEIDRQGAGIQSVMEGTPAEDAGLQAGDIITHLNGHRLLDPIPNEDEEEFDADESLPVQRLMALAQELDAGDEVEIRYLRDGAAQTVAFEAADIDEPSITILRSDLGDAGRVLRFDPEEGGSWTMRLPDDKMFEFEFREFEKLKELEELKLELKDLYVTEPNISFRTMPEGRFRGYAFEGGEAPFVYSIMGRGAGFGLELTELNPGLAEYFSSDEGLLVLNVDEESTLGLVPGDVILTIDGRAVGDQGDVRRILGSYEDQETVSFTLVRKGQEITVEGRIG
jgi:C-terminal processing protease CtpA/Prc